MHGTTHRALTLDVATTIGCEPAVAQVISEWSDFPDRVHDLKVAGEFTVIGRNLASLTHFQRRRANGKLFEGFCWRDDASLGRSIDLPNVDIEIDTSEWAQVVGQHGRWQHPMAILIAELDGHATLAADEITYSAAAIMAAWMCIEAGCPNWMRACGCACHFLQDCAVWHHRRGWLLRGHLAWEGLLDGWYLARRKAVMRSVDDYTRKHEVGGGSEYVRLACERTALQPTCGRPGKTLRVAAAGTAAIIRWFMQKAG